MSMPKYPLRLRLTKSAIGGAYDEIETEPVKAGWVWRIEIAGVINLNTAINHVRAWIKGHEYTHWIFEQDNPSADTLYWFEENFYVFEGESLVVRFTGCTAKDNLEFYITGYKQETIGGVII